MEYFFNGQEYLVGVYRLYEIICDLAADSLIHDVLLFALGDHYHRQMGLSLLDERQSLKSGVARHVLIKNHQIEVLAVSQRKRVAAIIGRDKFIPLVAKKHQVGFQKVDLIVGPKYAVLCCHL